MSKFKKIGLGVGAVVAAVVLFIVSTGGPSNAAALLTGKEIKNQSLESVDIAANGVGTSEIRQGTIYSGDINPATLKAFLKDTKGMTDAEKDQYATKGHANSVAADAENAAKGYADANDSVGINEARAGAGYTKFAEPGYSVQFAKCSGNKIAISGGYRLNGHASEAFSGSDQNAMPEGLSVVALEPAGVVNGELVNTYQHPDFPQTASGSFEANAIAVTFKNDTANPLPVRVWATCVNP